MNTLKISLEYRCYPIWEYSEDGDLIDNDLPEELLSDKELDEIATQQKMLERQKGNQRL